MRRLYFLNFPSSARAAALPASDDVEYPLKVRYFHKSFNKCGLKIRVIFFTEPLTSLQEESEESGDFKEPFVYDPSRPTMVTFPSALTFPTLDSERPFKPPKGKFFLNFGF